MEGIGDREAEEHRGGAGGGGGGGGLEAGGLFAGKGIRKEQQPGCRAWLLRVR